MENNISLSVVMPCLNEEKTLATCISQAQTSFSELKIDGEVVVADNGSSDSSAKIAASNGATIASVPEKGYGAALKGGINAASGKYIIMGDADLSYDFSAASLKPFIEELEKGSSLVVGNRFRGGISEGAMPLLHRYLGTPVMSWMLNFLYGTKLGDINCGIRGFRKEDFARLQMKSNGMEFASEMIIRFAQAGLLISEVPTTLRPDGRDRKPHLRSFRDGLRHMILWFKLLK